MSTSKITAIIADDEPLSRDVIKKYSASFPELEIVAECGNGLDALNKINELKPDCVFLDIQMPDLDGLSLLRELQEWPMIIFTTAYNQHAIKAFELNAVDYLLKPFDKERFAQALSKALQQKKSPLHLENKITALQNSLDKLLNNEKKFITRVMIKEADTYVFINVNDISWFEAHGDYVKIHKKDKSYLKNISLNELENKLNPQVFVRIHRSTIVNTACIKEMKPYFNGEYYIYLQNGEELKLSRSYKDRLKLIIDESI